MASGMLYARDVDGLIVRSKRYESTDQRKSLMKLWGTLMNSDDCFHIAPDVVKVITNMHIPPEVPRVPIVRPKAEYSNRQYV